ncbi:MAG: phenylalanine--tRNA ligase subunit beta [Rikenellaceae bacterium]
MKISYSWLKEYIQTDLAVEKISEILTDIGLEVEAVEKIEAVRGGLKGVKVGHVLTCEKHPDADKLHVTTVSIGEGEPLQIVCGAPNVAAGEKVLVATVGTTLYPKGEENGFKIKKSKIRGVESLGMLCASDELGIGEDHSGIMLLDASAKEGTDAKDLLEIKDDYLIEIGLTPNRVDASSHYGVARDLAAYLLSNNLDCKLQLPSVEDFKVDNTDFAIKVSVQNQKAAPRYAGLTIKGVKVAPSPEWMQSKLRTIGLNPHNNIVDITNFILHELGQPLHAFDADKIKGGEIVVRTVEEGTAFTTLDGVERKLSENDLMICDSEKPMCIAGVFGGLDSGVSDSTVNIFLESAYFNPVSIRKTAKTHGLNTDASFRYERGIDPETAVYALKRAAMLIKELAGGEITSDIVDLYPEPIAPFKFDISFANVNKIIGKELAPELVRSIISSLEITIESENEGVMSVSVPAYRVDVTREIDLIEDILRIYGYNNVEIPTHVNSTVSYAVTPDKTKLTNLTANLLSDKGFTEIMSNSLTKSTYYENISDFKAEECVKILNPLSQDLNVMRQSLLFNALEAVELNVNHKNADLKLYEFGNCYSFVPEQDSEGLAPYKQANRLAITVCGAKNLASWNVKAEASDFYALRDAVAKVFARFGLDIYSLQSVEFSSDAFSGGIDLMRGPKKFARLGVLSPAMLKSFDIKIPVYFAEIEFDALVASTKKHKVTVEELSKFPEVKRDLALLVDKNVDFATLRGIAFATEKKLLKKVSLFDVYEGDKLPEGKKSYALSFILEDKTQTLTEAHISKVINNLVAQFEKKVGASIRA